MQCKFPKKIYIQDRAYSSCEYESPTGGTLANVSKVARGGDYFSGLRMFLIGCIKSISDDNGNTVEESIQLKQIISKMPTRTADYVCNMILVEYNDGEDEIEGIYSCPRCGNKIISEKKEIDGMELDTCDRITDLEVVFDDGPETFQIALEKPVKFFDDSKKESIGDIGNIVMRFPTIEDGINAFLKWGSQDEVRIQFQMFVNALIEADGDIVDNKFRSNFGMLLFERMNRRDLYSVINKVKSVGMNPERKKHCNECGKDFKATVNTTSFFVSALR